jgi:hypothetical protein
MRSLNINPDSRATSCLLMTNKKWRPFLLAFTLTLCLPVMSEAAEIDELKAMVMKMEQRHQQEMAELRKQIEQLSKKQQTEPKVKKSPLTKLSAASEFYDQLQRNERMARAMRPSRETGFISLKGWNFDLGGELELEFVDTQNGVRPYPNSEPDAHFQIDQLYLYPTVRYKDLALFSADIAIKTGDVQTGLLEEAWARFTGIPFNTYVEGGINDLFLANLLRKTETEILVENAFYRDDALGVRLGGKPLDWLYWEASVTNDFRLGTRFASEDPSFPLLADRRNVGNASGQLDLGLTVGFNPNLGDYGKIDFLPFYYHGELSDEDLAFLQAIPGYGVNSGTRDKQRYGFNLRYDYADFTVIGQYLDAKDGALNRTGWFVQPSYVLYQKPNWTWFNNYELVYRYNDLNIGLAHLFDPAICGGPIGVRCDSLTWDRQQHVLGLIVALIDKTSLKFEYIINNETTGGPSVGNNEFLIQAEVIW